MTVDPVEDALGTQIKLGQTVVYVTRVGGDFRLAEGKVIDVKFRIMHRWPAPEIGELSIKVRNGQGHTVTIRRPDHLAVLGGTDAETRPDTGSSNLEPCREDR